MATTQYFNKDVTDAAGGEEYNLEIGTTNYAGEGPQVYLNFGGKGMILSHKDAKEFAEAVENIAFYFGQWKE
jgi:hypothetical protein